MAESPFVPALLVIDFQEDFCPPNGSLAVPDGRDIAPTVNSLLALPFAVKLATRDWHPRNHISFAANHPAEDGDASSAPQPFTSSVTISHPDPPSDRKDGAPASYETTLWPVHCVQDTAGAQLVPELRADLVHQVIDKGKRQDVEMYSAFYDPFRVSDSGLTKTLRHRAVTHVYVVGLAGDYCVRATAEHAAAEGYATYIVEEGTRPVVPDKWSDCKKEITAKGIGIVPFDGPEVARVKAAATTN
jgi:nicotinamidase-related amidase